VTHFDDDGFRFVGLREEPLENPFNRGVKRTIDFLLAVPIMLLLFPPLALIVWLAQRLQSPARSFTSKPGWDPESPF
jgi:lipopolysaccharide/colanic/teichoic acid biosynthesis glycosyltransferase